LDKPQRQTREIEFGDPELMSGPLHPNEEDDAAREAILSETEEESDL
jgi:hypothetical protein